MSSPGPIISAIPQPRRKRVLDQEVSFAASALAALYAALACAYPWFGARPAGAVMSAVAAASATALVLIAWYSKNHRDEPHNARRVHVLSLVVVAVVLGNEGLHLALVAEAKPSINLLLITVAAGFFLTSHLSFGLAAAASLISWFAISLVFLSNIDWLHYGSAWCATLSVATLIHVTRTRSIAEIEALWGSDRTKGTRLQGILHDAGREIEERLLRRSEARKAAIIGSSLDAMIEFDGAALMGHLEGNLELLSKLVDTFGRTSRVDLERLSRAIAAADCDEIRDVCHKLSGCVREFTSSGPIEHLDRLRTLTRSDRYEAVALRDAERALGAAIEELKEDLVRLLGEQLGS